MQSINMAHPQAVLPIVDLSRFTKGTAAERVAVAAEWDDILHTVGFCLLSGYDSLLPESCIAEMREQAAAFFAQPAAEKHRCYVDGIVGYLGPGDENVGATSGKPTLLPDMVESLNLPGYQEPGCEWRAARDGMPECPWLNTPWVGSAPESFRKAAHAYWVGATRLMWELMALSEEALGLSSGFFTSSFEHPGTLLRLAYYPPCLEEPVDSKDRDKEAVQQRYGAHTDYDGFTILNRDTTNVADGASGGGGLEIQFPGGEEWTAVAAKPGTLTINIGDLLARWTNDRWRSTVHRVAMPSPGSAAARCSRLSVVFFTGPHPDTVVKCLPTPKCCELRPRYEPITAKENVQQKMAAASTHEGAKAVAETEFKRRRVD